MKFQKHVGGILEHVGFMFTRKFLRLKLTYECLPTAWELNFLWNEKIFKKGLPLSLCSDTRRKFFDHNCKIVELELTSDFFSLTIFNLSETAFISNSVFVPSEIFFKTFFP